MTSTWVRVNKVPTATAIGKAQDRGVHIFIDSFERGGDFHPAAQQTLRIADPIDAVHHAATEDEWHHSERAHGSGEAEFMAGVRSGDVSVAKPLVLEPRVKLYSGSPSINAPRNPASWAFWIRRHRN